MTYLFSFRHFHNVTYPAGTAVAYTYDPMGNRLNMATIAGNASSTIAYTYDAGDELLSAGTITYTYDNNGNRIGKNEANGTTLYGYDAAGRLDSVSLPGSTLLQFAYDGDGNRLSKTVTSGNTTESTNYVWDVSYGLPQLLTESNGQGTALSLYGLQRISTTGSAGGQMYYQYDGLGSVRSLSDISGNTVNTYSYDAFGNPDVTTGQVDNDFRFTGEQVDAETGLIYLRARYYDPEVGRFISRDSFTGFDTNTQSLNRYTYVQNNPVRYTDPSGKNPWYAAPAVIGAGVNAGWYVVMDTDVGIGHQPLSFVTLGGRLAGGAAGGVAATVAIPTGNPYVIGAVAGGSSYLVDRGTQWGLSQMGLGSAEPFTGEGFTLSTGAGTVMGPVTHIAIPFSPTNTNAEIFAQNGISKAGMWGIGIGIGIDNFPSCQGPPFRWPGDGSIKLPGIGKE